MNGAQVVFAMTSLSTATPPQVPGIRLCSILNERVQEKDDFVERELLLAATGCKSN